MRVIRDRVAVVIGGGSGIGRGIALGLADAGARVVVADIEYEAAQRVAGELAGRGATALAAQVDATERDSLASLASTAVRELGAVHVLSNNVGILVDRRLDEAGERDWGWVIELNLMSIVRGVQVFLPALRAHGEEAHIVNTASMAAVLAQGPRSVPVHLGLYTATKHAVLGYTEILRDELAEEGIGVSVLCPGTVQSNLAATSARHRPERYGGPFALPAAAAGRAPAGVMTPEEVGPLVVQAIVANRFHIFTHPERRKQVEERQQRMLEDFDFAAGLRSDS